ncbi:PAS domain S-box protein [Undibacterium sp. Ren11W]|uniref:PAS domain S-box protein n=1 Tax=Undibacterium sp. Ren11W TaxID=3413045 RepID=UPI003BF140EC
MSAVKKNDPHASLSKPEPLETPHTLLKYDAIMDGAPMGILFTQDGIMVQANASFLEIMGYQAEQLIGQPASLLFFSIPENYLEIGRIAGPALAAGKAFRADIQASRQDGSLFWSRFSAKAVNHNNKQDGTLWFIEDVTVEHLHEQQLRQTLEEQRAIFESAAVGILYSHQRTVARCNERLASMFGYRSEELLGRSTRLFFRDDAHYGELSRQVYPALKTTGSFSVETQMPHRDGHLIWVHATGSQVQGSTLVGDEVIWIFKDISSRKAAEEENRLSLLELEAVFANAAVGFIYTREHKIQRCNARSAEIFGYAAEDLIGVPTISVFPNEQAYQSFRLAAAGQMESGQSYETEVQCKRKDGTLSWCHLHGKALNPADISQGSIWIVVDTDAARRTREQLADSMRDLEALVENASIGILFTKDRKITRYNPRFGDMFGYPNGGAIGLPASIFFSSQDQYEAFGQMAYPLLSVGLPLQTELYTQHGSGEKQLWVKLIAYLADPNDVTKGTIWLVEDRSAYKASEAALQKAQADLVQAEKQVALGSLVVGVAHELNTPIGNALMAASTLTELCQDVSASIARGDLRRSQLDSYMLDVSSLAALMTRACERAAQLVSSFKQVAVDRRLAQRGHFNLLELVQDSVLAHSNKLLQPGWKIEYEIAADIVCDSYPEPLSQIVVGIVENALTHGFEGRSHGHLCISATLLKSEVQLSFSDDGTGIAPQMLARVFDPFFTTRLGQGRSGLGLSISRNLATAVMGGDLSVASQLGQGTCFTLRFPQIAAQ